MQVVRQTGKEDSVGGGGGVKESNKFIIFSTHPSTLQFFSCRSDSIRMSESIYRSPYDSYSEIFIEKSLRTNLST